MHKFLGAGWAQYVIVAVQSVVGGDRRGVVTGTNMFFRSMGSAVGAAIFGAIANTTSTRSFSHPPAALHGRLPHSADATSLILAGHLKAEPGPVAGYIRASLFTATHHVFLALTAAAVLGVPGQPRDHVAVKLALSPVTVGAGLKITSERFCALSAVRRPQRTGSFHAAAGHDVLSYLGIMRWRSVGVRAG
ncbi:MAG TPA: hypothetical protein VE441_07295 [Mycobacterium sp.]|nr:hypothetical protein [Mycobacterium sp.]